MAQLFKNMVCSFAVSCATFIPEKNNMAGIHSNKQLHLQHRLWIAEMNGNISALRIFDDYFSEITAQDFDNISKQKIEDFKQQFVKLRQEIDELKHEMHLIKMNIAADLRESNTAVQNEEATKNNSDLKNRYTSFREKFDRLKQQIVNF